MGNAIGLNRQRVGGAALMGLLITLALALGAVFAAPIQAGHNSAAGDAHGTTAGWLDGREVTFVYPKDFFCVEPPSSEADSACELGAEAQRPPRPGANVPVLYVMTPLGFRPAEATLQCPVVGDCINHPSDIDVTRVFNPGGDAVVIPLPAHSHIVDVAKGGWWEIEVIGVTDPSVWDEIVDGKSLERVRELQRAGVAITGDIPTNLFLFFNVQD